MKLFCKRKKKMWGERNSLCVRLGVYKHTDSLCLYIFFYPQQIRSLMTKVCSNTTAVAVMVFNLFDSPFFVRVLFAYKTLPFTACSRFYYGSDSQTFSEIDTVRAMQYGVIESSRYVITN